jgi:hypothetical protein
MVSLATLFASCGGSRLSMEPRIARASSGSSGHHQSPEDSWPPVSGESSRRDKIREPALSYAQTIEE